MAEANGGRRRRPGEGRPRAPRTTPEQPVRGPADGRAAQDRARATPPPRRGHRAAGRTSERADDLAGVHRSPSRLRSRGAVVTASVVVALAVGVPVAAKLQPIRPAGLFVGADPVLSLPGTAGPGASGPADAVLPSVSLRPGAPIRTTGPRSGRSASPTPTRSATPTPTPSPSPSPSRSPRSRRAPTPPPGLSFEAEALGNDLNDRAFVRAVTRASGGRVVSGLTGTSTLGLRVPVGRAGTRRVTIHYVAAANRAANLSINGTFAASVAFPSTTGRVGRLTVPMNLAAGTNILGFSNPAGRAPDIDRVIVAS
ncbi:MAG TPA: hypothetical protein VFY17_05270 [Pilimelia sp.]|nr:hypothetical protein [Pilimelia sp.]